MGLFTRYAMDALMKTSHPEVVRRQCWNLHPHRTPCTDCKDICPYGDAIFTRPNLVKDWDPCTDCGLCVSVCRSGCIVPSPEQVQRDTSLADTDNDTLWLGCEKSSRKNTAVRTCVAAFSWETLAYLALNKKLVLDLTPCGECENDACAAQLRKELTRLVEFLGPQLFESRVTLAYQQEDAPYHVQELSRREMFSHMTEGSRAGTKKLLQMLPGLRSEEDSAADFRLLLHQRTKQLRCAQAGRPARRPDPRGRHAVEVQRVRRLCRSLLEQRHRRHEAAPADHPRPGERLQMQQDPLRRLRQAHRAEQHRGHLLGLPHQAPHQAASGGGRCPRQGADRRAGGPQGCGRSRQGRSRRAGRRKCSCCGGRCPGRRRACRCCGDNCCRSRNSRSCQKGLTRPQINAILSLDHLILMAGTVTKE